MVNLNSSGLGVSIYTGSFAVALHLLTIFAFVALLRATKSTERKRLMVKISGEYQGDLHCVATHGPSGSSLTTDAPRDNQGRGEAFSPTDLVATALGTCMATTMALAARRHNLELRGLKFEVTKEMSTAAPRRIVRLTTHLWLPFSNSAASAGLLEQAAHACPVHQSLHPTVEKPIVFHWPA